MSYAKLVKVCSDFGLGKQQVNGAITNLEAFYNAWVAEHAKDETLPSHYSSFNPYTAFGHHAIPQIPRAVVEVDIVTAGHNITTSTISAQRTVLSVTKQATGQWFIAMDSNLSTFWGIAAPIHGSSSDIRWAVPRTYIPTAGGQPGVYVNTYDSGGGSFALTEYSFVCAIYGY